MTTSTPPSTPANQASEQAESRTISRHAPFGDLMESAASRSGADVPTVRLTLPAANGMEAAPAKAAPAVEGRRDGGARLEPLQHLSYASRVTVARASRTRASRPHRRAAEPRISVVIPALNEARNLPHVLPHLPALVDEVILVDGRSTDGTAEVARDLLPTIRVIEQDGKGKGDALRLGFAASTGDIVVMLDADGSADPLEIPQFVAALQTGADFAKGTRFRAPGGSTDLTTLRSLGNRALCLCVNTLFHVRFTDLCYGYNAFWRRCLSQITIDCSGFEVETLLDLRMCQARFAITEVPSFEHPRRFGRSHLHAFRDGWRIFRVIAREWMAAPAGFPRWSARRPPVAAGRVDGYLRPHGMMGAVE